MKSKIPLRFAVVLLCTIAIQHASCRVLFVRPEGVDCPLTPCLMFSEYLQEVDQYFTTNTTFQFLSGNHTLPPDSIVEIRDVSGLTLSGDAANYPFITSNVLCNASGGLAFVNVSNLQILALSFSSCGAEITQELGEEALNVQTQAYHEMGTGLKATLFLVNVLSFDCFLVLVEDGQGYGLLGINVLNAHLVLSTFSRNNVYTISLPECNSPTDRLECRGGNALLIYEDFLECPSQRETHTLDIVSTDFLFGIDHTSRSVSQTYIGRGTGIGIHLSQSSYNVAVRINNILSVGNVGTFGANIYILAYEVATGSTISVLNSQSSFGFTPLPLPNVQSIQEISDGPGFYFFYGLPFQNFTASCKSQNSSAESDLNILGISNSLFTANRGLQGAGMSLLIWPSLNFTFYVSIENCVIDRNVGVYGSGLNILEVLSFPPTNPVQMTITNTSVSDNEYIADNVTANFAAAVNVFSLQRLQLTDCTFNNNAHTAIRAHGSILIFTGNNSFLNNQAVEGGAMVFAIRSIMYLLPPVFMYFENNYAEQRGGAIYVEEGSICFFDVYDPTLSPDPDVQLQFVSNFAEEAGSVLYVSIAQVQGCFLSATSVYQGEVADSVFERIVNFTVDDNSTAPLASDPFRICFCENGQANCDVTILGVEVFPGQSFDISAVAVGMMNATVPAVIRSSFEEMSENPAQLDVLESTQFTDRECSLLRYTIFSRNPSEVINIATDNADRLFGLSVFTQINVTLAPCPPGFELSSSSGQCVCDSLLNEFMPVCYISNQTILRTGNFWINASFSDGTYEGLIFHEHCPFDYCPANVVLIQVSEPDSQCSLNHSGILCGSCAQGLSLALGTNQCLRCTDGYLALLVPFLLAGFALVFLIFLCNLTVAVGTINGLIFYANIIVVNRSIFFPQNSSHYTDFLSVFISWLNLDFGIETCFYNGMDAYGKAWLQFVFPIYIWIIVGSIILASHFSSKIAKSLGNNPVSVLATLFLLSYAKLLRATITALSFTFLKYPDESLETVWLYDGNVRYLSPKHIPLFLLALLLDFVVFIPATFFLLLQQWLQLLSGYKVLSWTDNPRFRSIIDAFQAPYKVNHRYWTGLLLLVRSALFLVYAFNALGDPSVNLIAITAATLGLVTLTRLTGQVYQKWYLDALEASFLLNLGVLAAATYHTNLAGGNQEAVIDISVSVAFVTFLGIVAFHIYLRLENTDMWQSSIKPYFAAMFHQKSINLADRAIEEISSPSTGTMSELEGFDRTTSFSTQEFAEFREPLLDQ